MAPPRLKDKEQLPLPVFFPNHGAHRSYRGASARRRQRYTLLALLGAAALLYYYLYFPVAPAKRLFAGLNQARLDALMNHAAEHVETVRSSFDWSSVKFKHSPGTIRPLPTRRRKLPQIQHRFEPESAAAETSRRAKLSKVKQVFEHSWENYRKFAWLKDDLLPIKGGYKDQFSGWAATLVDSLDTMWIMGLRHEFDEAVRAVATIDFGKSSTGSVNIFETNIRYLGGLLSAYDLSGRKVLLEKAVELGDLLYAAYNTPNRMPVDFINFDQAKTGDGLSVEASVVSASPGTLSMEMTRLSQITGDPKYFDAVSRIMDLFEKAQLQTELPGMWPTFVSMSEPDVQSGNQFTLGACADSLYEYLPKMYALLGGAEPRYAAMSKHFMKAANASLFFRPMLPDKADILVSGNVNTYQGGKEIVLHPESEHLTCFIGGAYALGGRLFDSSEYVRLGDKLARACGYFYKAFPTGIMPERFLMVKCPSREECPWDEQVWKQEIEAQPNRKKHLPKGFTLTKDDRYILRPEAIESLFILYRITGNPEFQAIAWDMFQAIDKGTKAEFGNAAVLDVTVAKYPLPQEDYMESFWLGETLKYFYLMFSPPDVISLDDFVFNTEAHPFARPK